MIIYVALMAEAFMGYLLPWGQMSYWGAQVIINLFVITSYSIHYTKLYEVMPMDRVGLYVPGGKAAYPSSVLMNAIPAKVAGVQELVMVVPTPDGIV